jgi:hypothetical protein
VLGYPALWAHKAIGPTHLDEHSMTLLVRAIAAVELLGQRMGDARKAL